MNECSNDVRESCDSANCLQSEKNARAMGATKPKVPPKPKGLNKMVGRREPNKSTTAAEAGGAPSGGGEAKRTEDNGSTGKGRKTEGQSDQWTRQKPGEQRSDQQNEEARDKRGGEDTGGALAGEVDEHPQQKKGKDTQTEEERFEEKTMANQQNGQKQRTNSAEKASHFEQQKTQPTPNRANSMRRPKCKPPLPTKPKESEGKNGVDDKGPPPNDGTGGAEGVVTECQTEPSSSYPTVSKVRKPSARPPPPPADKVCKMKTVTPKPPTNPPPPPPKQWTLSNGEAQQNNSIYEEIEYEVSEGEADDATSEMRRQIGFGGVPKYEKRAVPTAVSWTRHSPRGSHLRKSGGRERGERRRTTQLEQWGRIKRTETGDKWEEEQHRTDQQQPMTSTPFSSASPSVVCCCSVCANSSPLLCRSMFLPSADFVSSPANSIPSPPMARSRSRIAKSEVIEQKLGRFSNELRLNLTRGMDKIRFRMALLNASRHCPSAHFCAIGKKLFAQQPDNEKNFASMRPKNGNKSERTAPIGANGKSTFYVSEEEENGGREQAEQEEEEDEFGDDWSTSSGESATEGERRTQDAEQAQHQQQMNTEGFPLECVQRPSLWEEIETEYQKRKRQRSQAESERNN